MAETKHPSSGETPSPDPEAQARREFLHKIGAATAMVPAAALLVAADFKIASAQPAQPYGGGGGCGCGCGGGVIPPT